MSTLPQEPALTVLLGLPFHDLTLAQTLDYCADAMMDGQCRYLVTANVDFTAQAYEDPDLRKIVYFADRVVCDGMPLVWLSRVFGHALRERVAGSDMVPKLLEICGKAGHGVYFFGSDLATLQEAKGIVEERYPGLRVVGIDSPPMGAVIEWDNEALCAKMRASGAKLLLVCLGCPKQERWIYAHAKETGIPLSIGVGASLDFITGKQKRAPQWMQKTGLEWFWRMANSPKRLASRYFKDFVFLVSAALRQARAQRRRKTLCESACDLPPRVAVGDPAVIRLEWRGAVIYDNLEGSPIPEVIDSPVLLDACRLVFMDSSGLGRLCKLVRACHEANQPLVVVNPAGVFTMYVETMGMKALFPMVADEDAAMAWLTERQASGGSSRVADNGALWVSFNRSLDAAYHEEMMTVLESAISGAVGRRVLVVDLKDVGFIDSRAVGGLLRALILMTAKGGAMFLSGASPVVREIIALLRLDKILAEWKGPVAE